MNIVGVPVLRSLVASQCTPTTAPYLVLAHYSMLARMEIRASMLVLVQPHLATFFYEYQHITIYWLGWRSEPVGC